VKHAITASFAMVLGLVLGGLPARSEIRSVRAELATLRKRDCGVGRGLAGLFSGGPMVERARRPPEEPAARPRTGAPPPSTARPAPGSAEPRAEPPRENEFAREALELRRTQARAALLEEADPSAEQLRTFDAAVEEMNGELRDLARIFVDDIAKRDTEPTRHELMVFAADTLDVVLSAGDKMSAALSEEQRRGVTEESIDPLSYVDPALADMLAEIDR